MFLATITHQGRTRLHPVRLAITCALATLAASSSQAATYTYTNGENNTSPITITEASTITLSSGSATQSGDVTVNGSATLTRRGQGTLTFSKLTTPGQFNAYEGTTVISHSGSSIYYLNIDRSGTTVAPVFRLSEASSGNTTLYIGTYSTGTLEIVNGATFNNQNSATLGNSSTGNGSLLISGTGSLFTTQAWPIVIGGAGTGSVTLSDGGRITAVARKNVVLGEQSTGRGYLNIESASGQAATAAGIFGTNQVIGGTGGGQLPFNHTSSNYVFTQSGANGGTAIAISGNVSMRVENGTTTLRDANTNTGDTTVVGGTLLISQVAGTSSVLGTGRLAVGEDGTVGGVGRVKGTATIADDLAPGSALVSTGIMVFDNGLTLESDANVIMEIGGHTRGTQLDALDIAGQLSLNGTLTIRFINDFAPLAGQSFDLLDGSYVRSGNFSAIVFSSPGYQGVFDADNGQLLITDVPEPSAIAFVLLGVGLIAVRVQTRKARPSRISSSC